jgi:hypothetical protein
MLQPRNPDHEELVQVVGEDGKELGPFQQRYALGVFSQIEDPAVERQPGQLSVQETIRGQLHLGWRRDQIFYHGRDLDCFHFFLLSCSVISTAGSTLRVHHITARYSESIVQI